MKSDKHGLLDILVSICTVLPRYNARGGVLSQRCAGAGGGWLMTWGRVTKIDQLNMMELLMPVFHSLSHFLYLLYDVKDGEYPKSLIQGRSYFVFTY